MISSVRHEGFRCQSIFMTTVLLLGVTTPNVTNAQARDACDAVLVGDLFNRVIVNNSERSDSREAIRTYLFSLSESEAYKVYETEYESAKRQGQSGSVGVNYFGIGGEADFQVSYDRKLSESEFSEKFNKAKSVYEQRVENTSDRSNSLASAYASYVRDPNTIEAWKACVLRERAPGIYAFASRDGAGTPYINVIWVPGSFAAIAPSIDIDFQLPREAVIAAGEHSIAAGTGRIFRVDYSDHESGFSVGVNGALRDTAGRVVSSFSSLTIVPPVIERVDPEEDASSSAAAHPPSFPPDTCKAGFVWREAVPDDHVCVTPDTRMATWQQNREAEMRRSPEGGAYGPDTCREGFVWREAFEGDHVCVPPEVRNQAATDNAQAEARRAGL